jgi:hypothetical protein
MKEWQQEQQRKYLDEIADLKTVFYNEIKVQLHMFISFKFPIRTARSLSQTCLEIVDACRSLMSPSLLNNVLQCHYRSVLMDCGSAY